MSDSPQKSGHFGHPMSIPSLLFFWHKSPLLVWLKPRRKIHSLRRSIYEANPISGDGFLWRFSWPSGVPHFIIYF